MTIKEFYDWACANGVENLEFGMALNGHAEVVLSHEGLDSCFECRAEDVEIGGYWEHNQKVKDFVWFNVEVPKYEQA